MFIAKLLAMISLSFVITFLILQGHLQISRWKMTDKYLSVNQNRHF
jgi:hypothetical protein